MSGVVVDTSVWIDFFSGSRVVGLEDALAQGLVVLPPIVIAELLSGARRDRDRKAITDLVHELTMYDATVDHWIRVGHLRRELRAKGLSVSTPDAHVAACALDLDALLLARDAVFSRIAKYCSLRVQPG